MSCTSISSCLPSAIATGASTPHQVDQFEDPFHEYVTVTPPSGGLGSTESLLICTACGTQFDVESRSLLRRCRICDDPRQYVPPSGQAFTTLGEMRLSGGYSNRWNRVVGDDDRFWSVWTEPKFGIGQRAILIKTEVGNVLWDCITYLDEETVEWINGLGGLAAIVISHPHYYSTHLEWADTFDCPVYLSWEDKQWLNRLDRLGKARTFIESRAEEIEINGEPSGVVALKPGGHFPGSLVCLAFNRLLVADTLVTTPSGLGDWTKGTGASTSTGTGTGTVTGTAPPVKEEEDNGKGNGNGNGNSKKKQTQKGMRPSGRRPSGMNSFAFMWSIPNMIPLSPEEVSGMWDVLKGYEFESTHGAFVGTDVFDGCGGSESPVKQRVLESMQTQVRRMGWKEHALLRETVVVVAGEGKGKREADVQ